ncbi:hypothetical protein Indivirus_1_13 [Indivirus ILV1]|uniref:Uncharacterized protein n=1 Tax=Indivirus ILV1 TaxID=1977633 RepID=A0A1V0SCF0_9VIRU|nr:hypothetical protein Indivirus_1_13 [Indivirus ILV1]
MIYCGINEAFNCSQIPKSEPNNNSETFDNYSNVSINNNNKCDITDDNIFPAFFTAQGDYSLQGPYKNKNNGTTVGQLRDENKITDSDSFSLLDSEFSNDSLFDPSILKMKNQKKKKISHEYYIDKMVKSLLEDNDSNPSIVSSQNNRVYNHVKSCKFCKAKINEKMKKHFKNEQPKELIIPSKKETFDVINLDLGYDLKEIIIIILAGIILVFILDLLVKIGKRMK